MTLADRRGLTRELVARTALSFTDAHGLRGLSMRKLGAELGVEAMSLYHYVESKDDLLDAILDQLYDEIVVPTDLPPEDWEAGVRAGARSLHSVLTAHQAAPELFASRPASSPKSVARLYWGYQRFVNVGLSPAHSLMAFRTAVSFVLGHVASETGLLLKVKVEIGIQVDALPADLRAFVYENQRLEADDMFEFGLETLVAGLRTTYNLP